MNTEMSRAATEAELVRSDNKLIRTAFRSLFIVSLIGSIAAMFCVLIDAAVTGRFLGTEAVAATGLMSPFILFTTMICSIPGLGLASVCTRYMGMARVDRVNQTFSIVFWVTTIISVVISVIMYAGAPQIASVLSKGAEGSTIALHIQDYFKGLAPGRVFAAVAFPLNGIMLLDNDRKRAVVAMLATLLADLVLDFANVLVFHGGMFGMALATSISGLIGFVILMLHFRKKGHVIRFTSKELRMSDVKDSFLAGFSGSVSQIGTVLRGFFFNHMLLVISGAGAVAALSVANNTFMLIIFVFLAVVTTTSTLCSLFFGEEDENAIKRTLGVAFRYAIRFSFLMAVICLIFAKPVASIFLAKENALEMEQAARFIRVMSLQYCISSINYPFVGGLLGTKQIKLNILFSLAREAVFPLVSILLLGKVFGLPGFEAGFVLTGVLVLLATVLVTRRRNGHMPRKAEDFMIQTSPFTISEDELFEASVKNADEVAAVSEHIDRFLLERGADRRTAHRFSLFTEEMVSNAVQHGFSGKGRESVDIRLVYSDTKKVIRFRDNGKPFDPLTWLEQNHPEDPLRGAGIRMVIGMAKDVQYIPALRMNNLIITV